MLLPASTAAQAPGDSARARVIVGIELDRQEIFDSSEATHWVTRTANSLHVRTQPDVITRELLFRVGEPYDSIKVVESARNLRSLGIFRDVRIDSVTADSGVLMRVTTRDGWSTKAGIRFGTSGDQVAFGASFIEDNFLGSATRVGVTFSTDPVRTTWSLIFRQPRLIGRKVGLGAQYQDRSDGTVIFAGLDKPFNSINDRSGFLLTGSYRDETVYQYLDGIDVPVDTLLHRMGAVRGSAAWAVRRTGKGYVRAGVLAQAVRNDYLPFGDSLAMPYTVTGAVGGYVEWSRSRFITRTGFQTFSRTEDVDLSTTVSAGLYAAPGFLGYDTAGVGPFLTFRTGLSFANGFMLINGISDGLITAQGVDSGGTMLSTTVAWNPNPGSLAVWHGSVGWLENPAPGYEFDLGLLAGPRAYGVHSFTGNRAFFTTVEVRRLLFPSVLKVVAVGLAAFADHGGAWWSGSPTRTGADAGLGLRIGHLRSNQQLITRVDLAWRFGNAAAPSEWIVSIGRGFVFSLVPIRPNR